MALALAGCGKPPAPATLQDVGKTPAELRDMLTNPNPEMQARGALGLSRLTGEDAREAMPDLIALLQSPSALVRQNAALALGSMGPEARDAVPALAQSLQDPEWAVRRQAAIALGSMGSEAGDALPALKRLESDPQQLVRTAAKMARAKISKETRP